MEQFCTVKLRRFLLIVAFWDLWCKDLVRVVFFFVSSVNPHSERASFNPANFSLSFKSEEGRRVELLQSVHRSRSPCCQDDFQGSTKNWDASLACCLRS